MRKSIRTGAVGLGLAAMVIAGTGVAYASHTKVSANGSTAVGDVPYTASADSSGISFTTNYGVEIECATVGGSGVIKRGATVAVPNTIGTIGTWTLGSCSMGPVSFTGTITTGNIGLRSHPANAGDPLPVTMTGVNMTVSATPGATCSFKAAGTLDGVIRSQSGTDGVLELVPASFGPPETGFGLAISHVVGCAGEIVNGDTMGAWFTDWPATLPSILEIDSTGLVTHS